MEELQGFSLGNPRQHTKGARLLPLFPLPSLFFLSPISSFPFFSLSPTTPEVCHASNPLVWSTKGAEGGINLPLPQVNRLAPFLFLLFCRALVARYHNIRSTGCTFFQKSPNGQHFINGQHYHI